MREIFDHLAARLPDALCGDEVLLLNLAGETSDFVRLNHARVRQAGHVRRAVLQLELVDGNRHTQTALDLSGDRAADLAEARDVTLPRGGGMGAFADLLKNSEKK